MIHFDRKKIYDFQTGFVSSVRHTIETKFIETEIMAFIIALIIGFRYVPYLNIVFTPTISWIVIAIAFQILFQVGSRVFIIAILSLFVPIFFQLITGNEVSAENTGNIVYFLLWYACVMLLKDLWKAK